MVPPDCETGVTTPDASTVAMAGADELHTMVPAVPSVKSIVDPKQTAAAPVIAVATGNGFTVTVCAADGTDVQPLPSVVPAVPSAKSMVDP